MSQQGLPEATRSELDQLVTSLIGERWYSMSFEKLAGRLRLLPERKRKHLLSRCEQVLRGSKDPNELLKATAVMLALYPESLPVIEAILQDRGGVWEGHFQLFFGFAHTDGLPDEFRRKIESLLEAYLSSIDRDTAGAAWMAGDCLGCHWPVTRALPILIRVARRGRFAAGRWAAVYGLYSIAERLRSGKRKAYIVSLLEEIAAKDRSKRVRARAEVALFSLHRQERERRKSNRRKSRRRKGR